MKCSNFREKFSTDKKWCSHCSNKNKAKVSEQRRTLKRYDKFINVVLIVFVLLCLGAFLFGKIAAGVIATLQIILTVVVILMKKQIINAPKRWMHVIFLALAVVFLVPYASLCKVDYGGTAREYGTLVWSDSMIARMLPVPTSATGKIVRDDEKGFQAYVSNASIEEFKLYTMKCSDNGFNIDIYDSDKSYSAENREGYKLLVSYQDNNVIFISVVEPEYDVSIEIECAKNLIFSKYDVDVSIDGKFEETINHGTTTTLDLTMPKGIHEIKFESAKDDEVIGTVMIDVQKNEVFKYKIFCTSSKIDIDPIVEIENSNETDNTDLQPNLTVENCDELASILSNKAEIDDSYSAFATQYEGRLIEFDGRIDYCINHEDYNTRFDYLVSAGDYDPEHQIGPYFKFENVAYYDLNTDLDTVSVGMNVHIVAKVVAFDTNSGLFYLDPVSVVGR